jgi:hypothetical protein
VDWNPVNSLILSGGEDCRYKVGGVYNVDWNPVNSLILSGGEDCRYKVGVYIMWIGIQWIVWYYLVERIVDIR